MNQKKLTIRNDEGLQARSAELLVHVAGRFNSDIWLERGNKRVNAKSIMGVLSLRLRTGDSFIAEANGIDADKAIAAIARLIEKGETDL
jgi:catabolite repression HPr-like protein